MDNTPMYATLPAEDLIELQASAYASPPKTVGDRVGFAASTIIWFGAATVAVTYGAKGVAKALDWFEEQSFQRKQRAKEYAKNTQ